jgi:hypothetical protein
VWKLEGVGMIYGGVGMIYGGVGMIYRVIDTILAIGTLFSGEL